MKQQGGSAHEEIVMDRRNPSRVFRRALSCNGREWCERKTDGVDDGLHDGFQHAWNDRISIFHCDSFCDSLSMVADAKRDSGDVSRLWTAASQRLAGMPVLR